MATTPTRPNRGTGEYRRRNVVPAAVVVSVLVVATVAVWVVAMVRSSSSSNTTCNPPAATAGTVQSQSALDGQQAAAPGDVRVTVFNGAGQRGQAQLAAVELGELGMPEAAQPDNDPLYPAQDLTCVGQIRYGPAGAAAARTLSVVVPCAELVSDDRQGDAVDLALGSDFRDITPSATVTDTLRGLSRATTSGQAVPGTDPTALTALRDVDCSG